MQKNNDERIINDISEMKKMKMDILMKIKYKSMKRPKMRLHTEHPAFTVVENTLTHFDSRECVPVGPLRYSFVIMMVLLGDCLLSKVQSANWFA